MEPTRTERLQGELDDPAQRISLGEEPKTGEPITLSGESPTGREIEVDVTWSEEGQMRLSSANPVRYTGGKEQAERTDLGEKASMPKETKSDMTREEFEGKLKASEQKTQRIREEMRRENDRVFDRMDRVMDKFEDATDTMRLENEKHQAELREEVVGLRGDVNAVEKEAESIKSQHQDLKWYVRNGLIVLGVILSLVTLVVQLLA